jgi:hypothetical protein
MSIKHQHVIVVIELKHEVCRYLDGPVVLAPALELEFIRQM